MRYLLLTLLSFCLFQVSAYGQMIFQSTTNGQGYDYAVHIALEAESVKISNPSTPPCPNGYNYQVKMVYNITFTGSNIPPQGLNTSQGYLLCGNESHYFALSKTEGSGDVLAANGSMNATNCSGITPELLGCNQVRLVISGPGIPWMSKVYSLSDFLLPIELSRFEAIPAGTGNVILNWQTASESNNNFFRVERSIDGRSWETLTEVKGAGTTSEVQNYDYMDEQAVNGVSYYRLRQTDYDGTFQYSAVRRVKMDSGDSDSPLAIYPNPAAELIYVTLNKRDRMQGVVVYNVLGQQIAVVKSDDETLSHQAVSIDVSSLRSGIYFVKSGQSVTKFYKN